MPVYDTEMDGFSLAESKEEIHKEEFALVVSRGEESVYRITDITGSHVSFKSVKFIIPSDCETSNMFIVNDIKHPFENRLSVNQMILIEKSLHRVLSIDKDTKAITSEEIKLRQVRALYPVYDRWQHNGRGVHWHQSEEMFTKWEDALGYIIQERGKGRRVSF